MESRAIILLLVLVLGYGLGMAVGYEEEDQMRGRSGGREKGLFLLQNSKRVVKTNAGDMRVVKSPRGKVLERSMHIGFITMEPNSLFIPQYLDSSLILFIRSGEAKVGSIYKDELVEEKLRMGDVYRIPAGSAFYLVNTGEQQKLHIICSIDPSESLGFDAFKSFFIGGGRYPTSILAGFDSQTISTAFNVSISEMDRIMSRQEEGPIVYLKSDSRAPSMWTKFLKLKEQERLRHLRKIVDFQEQQPDEEKEQKIWSWRKLLGSVFGQENKKMGEMGKSRHSYNLYRRTPDFENNYGSSISLDESDYKPLKHSGIGVYLVNLTAGSMMAPHVNPTATEYGVVLRGSGTIQIVFPNGSSAMNAEVKEGDVFWVPRYFPFCQIASRNGPMEFFGFTTSARKNRPQFLVGASSVLHAMRSSELAASFGMSEESMSSILDAQRESVILPPESAAQLGKVKHHHEKEKEKAAKQHHHHHNDQEEEEMPKHHHHHGEEEEMPKHHHHEEEEEEMPKHHHHHHQEEEMAKHHHQYEEEEEEMPKHHHHHHHQEEEDKMAKHHDHHREEEEMVKHHHHHNEEEEEKMVKHHHEEEDEKMANHHHHHEEEGEMVKHHHHQQEEEEENMANHHHREEEEEKREDHHHHHHREEEETVKHHQDQEDEEKMVKHHHHGEEETFAKVIKSFALAMT